jgi:hypothetical protein
MYWTENGVGPTQYLLYLFAGIAAEVQDKEEEKKEVIQDLLTQRDARLNADSTVNGPQITAFIWVYNQPSLYKLARRS